MHLSPIGQLMDVDWRQYLNNLEIDYLRLVKSRVKSPVISHLFEGSWLQGLPHYRDCPTIGTIYIQISTCPTIAQFGVEEGHNIDRCIMNHVHIATEVLQIINSEQPACVSWKVGWWHWQMKNCWLAIGNMFKGLSLSYMPPVETFVSGIKIFDRQKVCSIAWLFPLKLMIAWQRQRCNYHFCIIDYLLNGMVQVSEWNFDDGHAILLIMTMSSESTSIHLRVTWKQGYLTIKLSFVMQYHIIL